MRNNSRLSDLHTRTLAQTHIYTHSHTHTYTHTCMHAPSTYPHTHSCTHTNTPHTHACMHPHVHMGTHMHTNMQVGTHTHTVFRAIGLRESPYSCFQLFMSPISRSHNLLQRLIGVKPPLLATAPVSKPSIGNHSTLSNSRSSGVQVDKLHPILAFCRAVS